MNSTFLFKGTSISALSTKALARQKPAFAGTWRTIELQPDVFVPQTFTVGVVVVSNSGETAVKVLEDSSKFDCIYKSKFDEQTRVGMLEMAREVLTEAAKNKFNMSAIDLLTANLKLGEPRFTSGDSIHQVASRIFADVVVLAPDVRIPRQEGLTTRAARKIVNDQLRIIANSDYDKIVVPEGSPIVLRDKGKAHKLDINLRPTKACGAVVSTVFHSEQSVELNILRPSSDIAAYTSEMKLGTPAIFLLLPDQNQLDAKARKRVQDVVEAQEWKLEREGFQVVSHASESLLARDIYDWAKQAF